MAFDQEGFNREVGYRLHKSRKLRDLTQAHLAEALGVPRATYANIESGRQRVAVDVLWRAAVVLDVPINQLVPEAIRHSDRPSTHDPVLHGPTGPHGPDVTATRPTTSAIRS